MLDDAAITAIAGGSRPRVVVGEQPSSGSAATAAQTTAGSSWLRAVTDRGLGALRALAGAPARVASVLAFGALLAASARMFRLSVDISLSFGPEELEACLSTALPPVALVWAVALGLAGVAHIVRACAARGRPLGARLLGIGWALVVLAVTGALFLLSTMNLFTLHQPLLAPFQRWRPALDLYYAAQPWRLSSG